MKRSLVVSLVGIVVFAATVLGATVLAGNSPQLGLDLKGGASVVLRPTTEVSDETLDQTIDIIRRRIDTLGVAEPEISRQGANILVELPGVRDQDRALQIVGQTAQLRFRPVLQLLPPEALPGEGTTTDTTAATSTTAAATGGPGGAVGTPVEQDATTTVPDATVPPRTVPDATAPDTTAPDTTAPDTTAPDTTAPDATAPDTTVPGTDLTVPAPAPPVSADVPTTPREEDLAENEVVLPEFDADGNQLVRYRLGPTALTGEAVETAQAVFDPTTNRWAVSVTFKGGADGIDLLNDLANQCFNGLPTCPITDTNASGNPTGRMAIVLDSIVQSAPGFQTPNFDSPDIQISGDFTESEARDLATVLRFGALPVQLEPQAVQTVSATLGQDSLRAGVVAGVVGVLLVLTFMVLYYRLLGLVVALGLMVWAALMYATISFLGATQGLALTLAGATGIIVSIGVTVDSYVVYFERLKDEIRNGRTLRTSAERGFKGAFRTIVAADVASLIGAAVLWWLSVGSVRGFAFFLGLSTLLDLVVAFFFTRPMVAWVSRSPRFASGKVLGVESGEALAPADRVPAGAAR